MKKANVQKRETSLSHRSRMRAVLFISTMYLYVFLREKKGLKKLKKNSAVVENIKLGNTKNVFGKRWSDAFENVKKSWEKRRTWRRR